MKHFDLVRYFTLVFGSNLDGTHTSKTEIIQSVLLRLQKFPENVRSLIVMIGDHSHDIVGAHNNGIHSIAVTYGYDSIKDLQNAALTHFAHSVEDLKKLLVEQ